MAQASGSQDMVARSIVVAFVLMHATAAQALLPFAAGESSRPECIDAMRLAKAMYKSTAQRLYAPLKIPKEMKSALLLGATEMDISGGGALQNAGEFEELPTEARNVYWAKEAHGKVRIVVREIPHGWRGDTYSLYLLDESVQQETFLTNIGTASGDSLIRPVVSETWRPPLVFQQGKRGVKWFIDVGQPFQILADWNVYSAKERRVTCTITFHPPTKDAIGLLPKQVVALTGKLDEALGPGNDEGTLQPTARTRLHARHVLANAALRPWALSDGDAYNSRSEVERGLEVWANANRIRRRLHNEIQKAYPMAERSLANYYKNAHGLRPKEAQEVAVWVLDLVFRSYFVFSNGGDYFRYDGVRTNPWPMER